MDDAFEHLLQKESSSDDEFLEISPLNEPSEIDALDIIATEKSIVYLISLLLVMY